MTRLDRAGMHVAAPRLTAALGQVAVRDAIERYRAGEQVSAEHAAWLTVALRQLRVRDDAWARMEPGHQGAHLRLWTDLTRLARPGYVAAPAVAAGLLSPGRPATGRWPTSRSTEPWPTTPGTRWRCCCARRSTPARRPSMARLPMTPEEVAAAYDAAEAAEDAAESAEDAERGPVTPRAGRHGRRGSPRPPASPACRGARDPPDHGWPARARVD